MRWKFWILTLVLFLIPGGSTVFGQKLRFDSIRPRQEHVALFFGYGENHRIPHGTKDRFAFDIARIQFGRFKSPRNAVLLDVSIGRQDTQQANSALGVTTTFRHLFLVRGSTAASWDASFGIVRLRNGVSSLGTKTNFTEQLGFALQYGIGPATAVCIEYKFSHVSNGGIRPPNIGINASMLSIGYTWYR